MGKILVEEESWAEEVSMERVIEMARINMKMATIITKEIIQNQKGLEEDTIEWEEQEHKEWKHGKFSKIPEERMQGITDEEIQGFKQRWKVATKGAKLRKDMEERIENREKITKKEKREKEKKEKNEEKKRQREEEEEEFLKKLKGGGGEEYITETKEETKINGRKRTSPLRIQGGSRDIVPRGGSEVIPHVPTNTTLHYTTLHYTTLHYTTRPLY